MRVLFVSAHMPGHLDWGGYLATAAELTRLGHDTLWVSGKEVQPHVAKFGVPMHVVQCTGWRWPPPPPIQPGPETKPAALPALRMTRALDQWLNVELVASAVTELLAVGRHFRPQIIVSEMFVSAAPIVAELLEVPFVVAGWPAQIQELPPAAVTVAETARQRLHKLLATFGATGVNWSQQGPPALASPHLHVTYWSPGWFRDTPPMQPQTRHVGGLKPTHRPWHTPWLTQLPMDRPWVFITLGTSFSADVNFFIAASRAVAHLGGLPILAVGQGFNAQTIQQFQSRLPSPRVVTTEVDFGEVLPYVAAAIHHGGAGTTHALVTHAVPQIVVPRAADQGRQAEGVERTGVGVRLMANQVTDGVLAAILQRMWPNDAEVRGHAMTLQAEFAALGGVPRAAQLLLRVA